MFLTQILCEFIFHDVSSSVIGILHLSFIPVNFVLIIQYLFMFIFRQEGEGAVEGEVDAAVDDTASDPGAWEENFKSHHDTKPNGPTAVAMDFSFHGAYHAYGIPELADSFALKSTK